KTKQDYYRDGYLEINFSELSANINGNQIIFTPLEYRTLKLLTENPKSILTRKVLLEKLWDIDANFVDEHTLTSVISRIRSKIEKDNLKYIKTVYGMGYMWLGERNEF
ncbi:winged helix-turn-helix transcriptional regulator, partial [Clostridioides difficile]|nr:winged helix-turn-helix transcriptional regulator [Clostridioides difficile]